MTEIPGKFPDFGEPCSLARLTSTEGLFALFLHERVDGDAAQIH